jgi:hypothetical protein
MSPRSAVAFLPLTLLPGLAPGIRGSLPLPAPTVFTDCQRVPAPLKGAGQGGGDAAAPKQSSPARRRGLRARRCSRSEEFDNPGLAENRSASSPRAMRCHAGRRRFRSIRRASWQTQSIIYRPNGAWRRKRYPSICEDRRIRQILRSASVIFRRKPRARSWAPSAGCFFTAARPRRDCHPHPNPPPSRGRVRQRQRRCS